MSPIQKHDSPNSLISNSKTQSTIQKCKSPKNDDEKDEGERRRGRHQTKRGRTVERV